jgi:sec-independent protein translocase protein TatA
MNIGPAEILVVLVVALIAFGPKRLPEVGRQVGSAMRELRRMQHTVRSELDTVLHPDLTPPNPAQATPHAVEDNTDHSALPAPAPDDDGFAGPGSFS